MIVLSVKPDVASLARALDAFATRQLPFATSQALNQVARRAVDAERKAMTSDLDRPTSFTLRGVSMRPARKENPTAVVYIQPIQARYLAPSIKGGVQVLGSSRAILAPKNVRLNTFGNIPRGLLAALRARPDILIGPVTFADGNTINGVWQMPTGERKGGRMGRGITGGRRSGWKLLIRFADPSTIEARYPFGQATLATAAREFPVELRRQLVAAMRTAR
jgi:hypothetical protein